MTDLQSFVREQYSRGLINDAYIDKFTDSSSMKVYRSAFTHRTYEPIVGEVIEEHQERLEFLGDVVVNHVVAWHIHDRFPTIQSVKWLTRIKHNLISKKTLGMMAYEAGFEKHIRYGSKMKECIRENPDITSNVDYLSMLEDTFEAFMAAIVKAVNRHMGGCGGYEVARRILDSFLNVHDISLDPKKVFDAITRLKELYESKNLGIKWPIAQAYRKTKLENGNFEVIVYGWPQGDRKPVFQNRVQLCRIIGRTKDDTSQAAAEKAIEILERTYRISELPPNPYKDKK